MYFHSDQRLRDRGRSNGSGCRGIGRAAEIWTDADAGAEKDLKEAHTESTLSNEADAEATKRAAEALAERQRYG